MRWAVAVSSVVGFSQTSGTDAAHAVQVQGVPSLPIHASIAAPPECSLPTPHWLPPHRGLARHLCAAGLEAARAAGARGAGARPLLRGAGARPAVALASDACMACLARQLGRVEASCTLSAPTLAHVLLHWARWPADSLLQLCRTHTRICHHHHSLLQVACGDGLVRIYNFLRSDEPSQYPQVGAGQKGQEARRWVSVEHGSAWRMGRCGEEVLAARMHLQLMPGGAFCHARLGCITSPAVTIACWNPPMPPRQDRMDRSKEVTPADITRGALDKSDPVAGTCR